MKERKFSRAKGNEQLATHARRVVPMNETGPRTIPEVHFFCKLSVREESHECWSFLGSAL